MPFTLPTIPFTLRSQTGTGVIVRQSASNSSVLPLSPLGRLDASIVASALDGSVATLTSLGFDGGFTGPEPSDFAPSFTLMVRATTASLENGMVAAGFGFAHASASLSIFIEEFSPTGAFRRGIPGPETVVFDASAAFVGFDVRSGQQLVRTVDSFLDVVPDCTYRIWLDSIQSVSASGFPVADAVSNFSYVFPPVFHTLIRNET